MQEIQDFINQEYPVETIINSELIYSDSAIVRVVLNAEKMNRYVGEKSFIEISDGLVVNFYNNYGNKESELTAVNAIINEVTGLMEAKNKVKIISKNGDVLQTEHLIWDQKEEKIFTEDFVQITTSSEQIYGEGFESNQDFTKYEIKKVSGTILLDEDYD